MDGHSLRKQIDGMMVDDFVFSELNKRTCLRSNSWKVVFQNKSCAQLYNLQTDNYEKKNL